jgi:hypothetical protein
MKPRTTLFLAAVLVVLAVIATVFNSGRKRQESSFGKLIYPADTATKADGIEVHGGRKTVTLHRRGETWLVVNEGNQPADPKIPQQLLDGAGKLSTRTLISVSRETHPGFQVDSTGFTVRITQGAKSLAEFVVGKPGPDYMSTYVRPTGGDKVYLIPAYLRSVVDRGDETWRNRIVLEVPQDKIVSYTTRNSRETVTVEKGKDGEWNITAPVPDKARPDIIEGVLRGLASIRAAGFADSTVTAATCGIDADTTAVVVKIDDGTSFTIRVGETNSARQSYTRKEGDPVIYLVPRGRWNTIIRPISTLNAASKIPPVPSVLLPGQSPPSGP